MHSPPWLAALMSGDLISYTEQKAEIRGIKYFPSPSHKGKVSQKTYSKISFVVVFVAVDVHRPKSYKEATVFPWHAIFLPFHKTHVIPFVGKSPPWGVLLPAKTLRSWILLIHLEKTPPFSFFR